MATKELVSPLDAPPAPRFLARGAPSQPAQIIGEPETFTLDPLDDDHACAVPSAVAAQVPVRADVTERVVAVEARRREEDGILYVAMGLGIACTVLALAMLLAGGAV